MKISMDSRQAKEWLGATPPDLTLVARSRAGHNGTGSDYLYTYLRTYYRAEHHHDAMGVLPVSLAPMDAICLLLARTHRAGIARSRIAGQPPGRARLPTIQPGRLHRSACHGIAGKTTNSQ